MGLRLGLVVRGGSSNPAARVRALEYVPALGRAGVSTRTVVWRATSRRAVLADSAKLMALARWADVVLLQRPNQPRQVLDALVQVNQNLVVDFDDALWASATGASVGEYGVRLAHAVRMAKHVTPGSEYLASWARREAPNVPITVIRPTVDLKNWSTRVHRDEDGRPLVLGWIGTPGNLRDFGPDSIGAIRELVSEGRASFRLITSGTSSVDGVQADVVAWSRETEPSAVASIDIGLMPLADNERSRGRCGYKAIQYLASGVPTVASPVGAAVEIVQPGRTGHLASGTNEWRAALGDLIADVNQRRVMGLAGREWVNVHASRDAGTRVLLEILHDANA